MFTGVSGHMRGHVGIGRREGAVAQWGKDGVGRMLPMTGAVVGWLQNGCVCCHQFTAGRVMLLLVASMLPVCCRRLACSLASGGWHLECGGFRVGLGASSKSVTKQATSVGMVM